MKRTGLTAVEVAVGIALTFVAITILAEIIYNLKSPATHKKYSQDTKRLIMIQSGNLCGWDGPYTRIIRDNEAKKEYIIFTHSHGIAVISRDIDDKAEVNTDQIPEL